MGTDAAGNKDSGDYLGYGAYADTLWARIARALNKDASGAKLGDDPLVVGIFGEWGAGKSKLLSLVMERAIAVRDESIANHKPDGYAPLTVPVFFQPWKYEHEKHLLVPMLLHIVLALEDCLKQAKTLDDALVGTVRRGIDGALQQIGGVVKATKTVLGVVEPGSAAALATAQALTDTIKPSAARKQARDFTWREDGRAYYELHDILRKVTRPGKYAEVTGGAYQDKDFACNFVIFIDDLDRCLPEKAVEALELIKTVFNLESFAFVLALDEEVIERGIGHRYVAYNLAGKKPEMPITGFEYLEKIVHLPFRLPALTRAQAMRFLREYEERVAQPDPALRWFSPPVQALTTPGEGAESLAPGQSSDRQTNAGAATLDLATLALDGFDVYVPRKLVRLVELMHAVAAVARARGRPLSGHAGGDVDVRVVLALLMIQLFQPEMYRLMRRRINAFPALLSAFPVKTTAKDSAVLAGPDVSDVDLWDWVGHGSEILPRSASKESVGRAALELRGPKHTDPVSNDPLSRIEKINDVSVRALAQQVRLPMVSQIVEYRSAQRHGFDLLKLMQALARSVHASGGDPDALVFRPYVSLLGQVEGAEQAAQVIAATGAGRKGANDTRPRFSPGDLAGFFTDWQSPETSVQANLAGNRELPEGHVLEASAANALLAVATNALEHGSASAQKALRKRLAQGLVYLAPYLSRTDGPAFWTLLGDELREGDQEGQRIETMAALAHRERWMDVRSTLGADPRWNAGRLGLPVAALGGHDEKAEPIPGFVRVPAGQFTIGADDQTDNLPKPARINNDLFIARHLTTVDQFAAFAAAGGYETKAWWDSQGWAWRHGTWASGTTDEKLRLWLDERTEEHRGRPMHWAEQQAHGSRAVWGVNWFEARAYARWLTAQLADDLRKAELDGYEVRLPVEAQWERAARAADAIRFDGRPWPWGNDENVAALRANIDASKIGRASVVGLFAPNPLGLTDLAGNLWEWQDNLFNDIRAYKAWKRIRKIEGEASGEEVPADWLGTAEDWSHSALPSLRGGSWFNSAVNARTASRIRYLPDDWRHYVGFRVVLSLASKGS